jgi:hypothetical protein
MLASAEAANLALRFLLELTALAVLASWGWQATESPWRLLLTTGCPVLLAIASGAVALTIAEYAEPVRQNLSCDQRRSARYKPQDACHQYAQLLLADGEVKGLGRFTRRPVKGAVCHQRRGLRPARLDKRRAPLPLDG